MMLTSRLVAVTGPTAECPTLQSPEMIGRRRLSTTAMRASEVSISASLILAASAIGVADEHALDPAVLEADAAVIRNIVLDKRNVFDISDPKENRFLYRLANRFHVLTRDKTIRQQLLFSEGDAYSKRLVEESERILRSNRYFYDARITPISYEDGSVDLAIMTKDVWTLSPGASFTRSGGENEWSFELEDLNLLGRGEKLRIARTGKVDRDSTSLQYSDQHVGNSWVALDLFLADNSDGHARALALTRPFFALDTRWAAGISLLDDERNTSLYRLGERIAEYRHQRRYVSAFRGWSKGLANRWVRRYFIGATYDDNRFSEALDTDLPSVVPRDRTLVYPYLGIEIIEDRFEKIHNRDQIEKTEDFFIGTRLAATAGWSASAFGADRNGLVYSVSAGRGFGSIADRALLLSSDASGRVEDGSAANTLVSLSARYYQRQSSKRVFFATLSGTFGSDLDLDNPVDLGGASGLRGYPLRYQSGDSNLLISVEQRYFTDWYPFRLVRIGGAVFFDAGRTWGDNPLGGRSLGWLKDVGIGLRLAPTRLSSGKIVHIDIAFPLDGDATIDNMQVLIEAKRSF